VKRITIVINEAPGSIKAWNALRIADGMCAMDNKVHIFLLDNGVFVAKDKQCAPDGLKLLELSGKISEIIEHGADVYACGVCLKLKGMEEKDLVKGVKVGALTELCKLIDKSEHVLTF